MERINVYVMIGLPGAGKDTWIKNNLPDCKCIACRDDIRVELGLCGPDEKYCGTNEEENLVSGIFNAKLRAYAESGQDIVINNTNIKRWHRNQYKKILKYFPVKWIYVVVKAPSIEDNINRRAGQISPETLRNMAASYQPPTPDEYDEIIEVNQ